MKHEEKKWKVRTEVGAAFGDSEGNFAGKTLSRGTFVVDGEFGTLEGARKLISAAPEMLEALKMIGWELELNPHIKNHQEALWVGFRSAGRIAREAIEKAEGK